MFVSERTDEELPLAGRMEAMDYFREYVQQAGFVPSVALVAVFAAFLRAVRDSFWRVALLSLPGTVAHELSHLVVGFLVGAQPHGFSLWPRRQGKSWVLGFVTFRNINLLNGAFVALAPLLLLPLSVLCFVLLLLPLWAARQWGWWLLAGYATAAIFLAAVPSVQDLRLGGRSLLLYAAVAGIGAVFLLAA
jgi:hypothetical protein